MVIWEIIAAIVGILLLIVAFCALVKFLEKKFPTREYDERQKAAQGRASRLGMITGMLYFMVVMTIMIFQVDNPKTVEPYLLIFIGILLMITVDHAYCFLSHAALPISQNPFIAIVGYGICGIIQLLTVILSPQWYPLEWVGHGTSGWIHLLAGMDFLFLAVMHLLQYLRDRTEKE